MNQTTNHTCTYDSGTVISVANNIVTIEGLYSTQFRTVVYIGENRSVALVLSLDLDCVRAVVIGTTNTIQSGDKVVGYNEQLKVPVGKELLGRVVDGIGNPLDDLILSTTKSDYVYKPCAPLVDRSTICNPLLTGIKMIDYLFPIGKGQRELIVGNKSVGKTQIAIDTIIAQRDANVKCILCLIGQPLSKANRTIDMLRQYNCLDYTTVVCSYSSDHPMLVALTPFAGTTMGEYFMEHGEDALIVYDDMQQYAWAHRATSLLCKENPGRESYSGNLFFSFASLLERSACVSEKYVESKSGVKDRVGSLTAIPIVEIQNDDVSSYVSTSLISIADGQLLISSEKFQKNIMPAINVGLSVSRVGSDARDKAFSHYVKDMKYILSQYEDRLKNSVLSSSSSDDDIIVGRNLTSLLEQEPNAPLTYIQLLLSLVITKSSVFKEIKQAEVKEFVVFLLNHIKDNYGSIYNHMLSSKKELESICDINLVIEESLNKFRLA